MPDENLQRIGPCISILHKNDDRLIIPEPCFHLQAREEFWFIDRGYAVTGWSSVLELAVRDGSATPVRIPGPRQGLEVVRTVITAREECSIPGGIPLCLCYFHIPLS
jgi:hypothetical protein